MADLLDRCRADGPPPPPGARWSYSNFGYLLARIEIERRAGTGLADLLRAEVIAPLDLADVRLAEGTERLDHLPGSARYDFGWVYHGCLLGPAASAARFVDAALGGDLLSAQSRAALTARRPLDAVVPGRPWTRTGYGLGLMSGAMGAAGPAAGHSGRGPFSTCAVYRFTRIGRTVAAFSRAATEAVPERAAGRVAGLSWSPP